ncbi:single-stranded DNA-binding protein [Agromyces sp. MMS24-JH15]|uniref:single-stranded DNA-binding protein n=1 Tax=Agromyces sp. MMS24-JH15 TaxID=3243765 RepID=UPI00374A0085
MTDLITITGIVGSDPRSIVTDQQRLAITSFRLASTRRYFDRASGTWANGETNWYTVSAFRTLADNAQVSLRKGEHVIVHGRLKLREWQAGERSGIAVEIEADAIGHDLTWGVTSLRRLQPAARPVGTDADDATGGSPAEVGADTADDPALADGARESEDPFGASEVASSTLVLPTEAYDEDDAEDDPEDDADAEGADAADADGAFGALLGASVR